MVKYYLIHRTSNPDFGNLEGQYIHFEHFVANPPLDASCFFIEASEDKAVFEIIEMIRSHLYPCVYPVPIVLAGDISSMSEKTILAADNVLSHEELTARFPTRLIHFIESCCRRIERFPDNKKPVDINIVFKIIRHIYIRDTKLVPHRCIWDMHGWVYPQLIPYIESSSEDFFFIFDFMESQNIVTGEFYNKIFCCSRCKCAFLNFREICPDCGSLNLKLEDIIHHFPCAYIGPHVDFSQDNILICPKCDKELRHIGVDYDKPSIVYSCKDCSHNCQDPVISTECFHCGRKAPPEEVDLHNINIYSLTSLGKNAALYGINSLFRNMLNNKVQAIPLDIFNKFLTLEIERIRRYKLSESTLIYINIKNIEEVHIRLGNRSAAIFDEILTIIISSLRKSDIITVVNNSLFLIILFETPLSGAEDALRRIKESVLSLLSSNLEKPVKIQGGAMPINGEHKAEVMIIKVSENVLD